MQSFDDESTTRSDLVSAMTTAGWLALISWSGFLFWVIGRVIRVGEQQFGGVWEQRIEVLSFVVIPPNSIMLLPAAALACLAAHLSGPTESLSLAVLLRLVLWVAIAQIAIAVASLITILFTETGSPTEAQDIGQRLSGVCMMSAVVLVVRAIEGRSPGGAARPPSASS